MQDILRLTTIGDVDSGKSMLLGQLIIGTNSVSQDQLESLKKASDKRGRGFLDVSLLLDGLAAEREQGITIDVAYRYFQTSKRRFIVADCPGHEQYTRNMVTGASNAQVAIILIDAQKGIRPQSKRHGYINHLLGIHHLIVCINKMDTVNYDPKIFHNLCKEYGDFLKKLNFKSFNFIPVVALTGENISFRSSKMRDISSETLLECLESISLWKDTKGSLRMPIQGVLRPHQNYRGFMGRIARGSLSVNDTVSILPSLKTAKVKSITSPAGDETAVAGQSISVELDREIDISRGDCLATPPLPSLSHHLKAQLCWLNEDEGELNKSYFLQCGSMRTKAWIYKINHVYDIDGDCTLEKSSFSLNDVGQVELETADLVYFDHYKDSKLTGSFILIDTHTGATVGAGMVEEVLQSSDKKHLTEHSFDVSRHDREVLLNQKPFTLWFTGLSGSGKSTIANALQNKFLQSGRLSYILDGDTVRTGLCSDLGFSLSDRKENIRRVAEVCKLLNDAGVTVIAAFISPMRADRKLAKSIIGDGWFKEIYIQCPVEECKIRDPKGLYKKADKGEIPSFTGVSSPYESPRKPFLKINTLQDSIEKCVDNILKSIEFLDGANLER